MPLIVGNRIKDIKPEIVVPRCQKGAKNPLVSAYVRVYPPPPAFRNHKSQSYEIRNLSSI